MTPFLCDPRERLNRLSHDELVMDRPLEGADVRVVAFNAVDNDAFFARAGVPGNMPVLACEKAHSAASDANVQDTLRL